MCWLDGISQNPQTGFLAMKYILVCSCLVFGSFVVVVCVVFIPAQISLFVYGVVTTLTHRSQGNFSCFYCRLMTFFTKLSFSECQMVRIQIRRFMPLRSLCR